MKTKNNRKLILKGIGRRYRAAMERWNYLKADKLLDLYIRVSLGGR